MGKERRELNEATKACIAAYRRVPSAENYAALKRQVEANYDAVIADREHRIAQTMARFTDSFLAPRRWLLEQ